MSGGLVKRILEEKLARLSKLVEELSLKGLIVASESMNRWVLGKSFSSVVSVKPDGVRVYVPVLEYTRVLDYLSGVGSVEVIAYQRYPLDVPEGFKVFSGGLEDLIKREIGVKGAIGCDLSLLSKRILDIFVGRCVDVSEDLWAIRASKSQSELEAISRAAEIVSRAYLDVIEGIHEGISERELAGEIDRALRRRGSEGYAFPTIVASGPNASYPHAEPSDRVISGVDAVVIDMGAIYMGYVSDMTRMVIGKKTDQEVRKALEAVEEALNNALEKISPGAKASEIDEAARSTLEKRGYGKYYIHSTGHGVGVEVHEQPILSRSSQATLEKGYVVTVEPGIYIPGKLGVRLEELVLVSEKGAAILTKAPRITTI
ncbi:MAG: aminopeptidase P family protein [Sulfolobales archaeon]